jgi:hypothetical protein
MLKDIIEVRPLDDYCLYLKFEDGVEGDLDIAKIIKFTGVFEPLQDRDYFVQVRVHPELGTIYWPNEADLDPDVLYAMLTTEASPVLELA